MEDRVYTGRLKLGPYPSWDVVAVMDGHGGYQAAEYCREHLADGLKGLYQSHGDRWTDHLTELFEDLNQRIAQTTESGTTLSLFLHRQGQVVCANVGDSHIYGFAPDEAGVLVPRRVSCSHKHSLKRESQRLKEADRKFTIEDDYLTVPSGHQLAMTRALGDRAFGELVSAVPYVSHPGSQYRVFVVASDGLWDVLDRPQLMQDFVKRLQRPRSTAAKLNRWRLKHFEQHDNTSVVVIKLPQTPAAEFK